MNPARMDLVNQSALGHLHFKLFLVAVAYKHFTSKFNNRTNRLPARGLSLWVVAEVRSFGFCKEWNILDVARTEKLASVAHLDMQSF